MNNLPSCPKDYSCSFTLTHPRIITHEIGPWWHGGGGLAVAILAVIAIAFVLAYIVYYIHESWEEREDTKQRYIENKEKRAHEIAMEEQRTFQAEQAKGNPEMLKLIREKI